MSIVPMKKIQISAFSGRVHDLSAAVVQMKKPTGTNEKASCANNDSLHFNAKKTMC